MVTLIGRLKHLIDVAYPDRLVESKDSLPRWNFFSTSDYLTYLTPSTLHTFALLHIAIANKINSIYLSDSVFN